MRYIAIALFLVSTTAVAQRTETVQKPAPVLKIDFEPDLVEGGLAGPVGDIYFLPPRAKFGQLIQIRMNFNDKLRESVHEM